MCANCTESFKDCSNFKLTCLDVEDFIVRFNNRSAKLDLRDIYLSKTANDVLEDHDICRLCMSSLRICSFISLDGDREDIMLEKMMLEKCLPKLDLHVTEKPLICVSCHGSLLHCFGFMTNCLMAEEQIKRYCDAAGIVDTDLIKLEDVLEFATKNILRKDKVLVKEQECNEDISEDMLANNDVKSIDIEEHFLEKIEYKIELATEHLKDIFCEDKELVDGPECKDELLCISQNLLTNKDVKEVDLIEIKETFLEEIASGVEKTEVAPVCLHEKQEFVDQQKFNDELLCISEKTPMDKEAVKKVDGIEIEETLLGEISKIELEPEYLNGEFRDDEEDEDEQECTDELPYISENILTNEDVE